jgi:hypothetical protein
MTVQFNLKGGPQLQRRLVAIGKAPREILREVGIRGVAESKALVPRRTGNLGRTIRLGALTPTSVEIHAGGTLQVGYAAAVEFGTRPHVIVPRKARVLAWGGARTLGGRLRAGATATSFAARVNHPGSKAHPYLRPGLAKALDLVGLGGIVRAWNDAA